MYKKDMEASSFYLRQGWAGEKQQQYNKENRSAFLSFIFLNILSNIGVILFQAEEAQRKLKRQNREDTGIFLREKRGGKRSICPTVYCPE